MEAIRFIFEIAKQVYGPNSMKIMLVEEKRSGQSHGPMNINISDSLFTFIMQADLVHPVLHVLRSMISSVYSVTRDGSALCIIFLYLLIRAANKASLNYANDFDSQDPNVPPHLVPLMDIYQSIVKPELDQLTVDVPLDPKQTKEEVYQLIYSVINTKLDDRVAQELSAGLSKYVALNDDIVYNTNNYNLLSLHSLPQLPDSITKESLGSHHMIVKGLILPINAVNVKIGLKLVNPKPIVLHASLESKLATNKTKGPKLVYGSTEERMRIEEEDRKIITTATMKVIESGASILFITQPIGAIALHLLTNYGVLVFQASEEMVKYLKRHISIEEYWDCSAIKPITEPQSQISNVTAYYGPFAAIINDNNSIGREEQWALIYTNNNNNNDGSTYTTMPYNLLLKGLGISDLAKQALLLVSNSMHVGDTQIKSLKVLKGAGHWMTALIKKLKIASNTVTDASHVRAIEAIVEALNGVHHQLVHNIRAHTNQFEENQRPVILDSYFVIEKTMSTTLELAQVLMRIDQIIKPQIIPIEFLQESISKQTQKTNAEPQESTLYREEEQHAKETMRSVAKTSAVMEQERERVKRQRDENDREHQTRVIKLEQLLHRQYGEQFSAKK